MNPRQTTYDFIISGFGCAGMSLVYYLVQGKFKNHKILIVDSAAKKANDRTWCYWAEKPLSIHPTGHAIISWQNISLSNGHSRVVKSLENLRYFHIKSSDFYREILALLKNFPNIHLLQDSILECAETEVGAYVKTEKNGIFHAEKVFNSIPNLSTNRFTDSMLKQVFVGWKIKTQAPCFDANTVVLMDFLQGTQEQTDFFYILPYSDCEALVEYTLFSDQKPDLIGMERNIDQFIKNNLGQEAYEITFREQGSIPMSTRELSPDRYTHIIPLGTLAGCSKPSTGFTFYTIQKHCQWIVTCLEQKNFPRQMTWKRKAKYLFYDNILLNIARKWPKKLPAIFMNLFQTNSGPEVLKFLNEESSFFEDIKILSRLKFPVFIQSLLRYEKH
ncbi:MAG: Lycopene beta cyclase [Lunatimonas sp.]|uniref:lycopene cyclase family protein n=1 Tax=Lunatimonas sp. TaxID=2060141 RepID=UPI00263B652A|nr:lycopene cyclase family protein [Lunatimonas sp.]MCC5937048.1 Lycopene beta cyclase [Lunatimonas sp.]